MIAPLFPEGQPRSHPKGQGPSVPKYLEPAIPARTHYEKQQLNFAL